MVPANLSPIRQIPILDVAKRLGIQVRGKKAMCFGDHDRHTPSLSFMPSKGIWKCFGCGRRGDAISLVREVLSCDFATALVWFANQFSVDVRRCNTGRRLATKGRPSRRERVTRDPAPTIANERSEFAADPELYGWLLGKCGVVSQTRGLEYLKSHGIPLEVANGFGVRELRDPMRAFRELVERWGANRVFGSGLAWGDNGVPQRLVWTSYAILFPFHLGSTVDYVQGRLFRGQPKYLSLRGIAKPLYNVVRLRDLALGATVHLCEGVPDAIALEAQGLAAVGVLGATSFRPEWVDMFMRFDVVLMPDGDSGGKIFQQMISNAFWNHGKAVRTVWLPAGKDVADVLAEIRSCL